MPPVAAPIPAVQPAPPSGGVNTQGQSISVGGGSIVPSQAVLVSSSPARAATSANVTKLQTVTAPPPAPVDTSKSSTGGGITINNTPAQSTTLAQDQAKAANQGKPGFDVLGNPITAAPGTDGSNSTAPVAGQYDKAVAGIADQGLAAQFKTQLQNIDTQITQAQNNISAIQARTLNDPAVQGIVSGITAKYNQQIQLMKDKNQQLLGRANTSVAAFGGLGMMSQNFLTNQQQRADDRIQSLQDQEDAAIAKAQAAYLAQNFKDLNAAMTEYDKVNADKLTALNDLLTASSRAVSEAQAQQRLDQQAVKDQLASDVTTSTKISEGVAANIAAAGITDPGQIKDYVTSIASQYGITNPDLLYSAVVSSQALTKKNDLAAANVQSQMDARDKNLALATQRLADAEEKAAKGPKPTQADIESDFYSGLPQLEGKADSSGTPYYHTAADSGSYLTWTGFKTLLQAAKVDGIDRASFIKQKPDLFDPNGLDGYGLTAKEKAIIAQS